MNEFSLTINGRRFTSCWQSIDIQQSMDSICGSIAVKTTDFYPGDGKKWGVRMGDQYIADIDGQVLSLGYIEEIPIEYSGDTSMIEFHGRDATADIVDCTAESREFKNQTIQSIISSLCAPYGIFVTAEVIVAASVSKVIPYFVAEEGQPIFEIIARICLENGIIPVSYGDGALTLSGATKLKYSGDALGSANIISARYSQSNRDRYKTYICKGTGNSEQTFERPEFYVRPKSTSYIDAAIKRERKYIFFDDNATDDARCLNKAKYEAMIRAGQSRSIQYVVEGWTEVTTKRIWRLNTLVWVNDPNFRVSDLMLISGINFSYDETQGFSTTLSLVHKNTYSMEDPTMVKGSFDEGGKEFVRPE